MLLVDTSVWIDYLNDRPTSGVSKLAQALDEAKPCGLTSVIYQEVLQGSDSELSFRRLQRYLSAQIFYFPFHPIQSYAGASQIYRRCREKGITIRSTLDCLIAQVAIEHELFLLHSDKDFDRMAGAISELKIY